MVERQEGEGLVREPHHADLGVGAPLLEDFGRSRRLAGFVGARFPCVGHGSAGSLEGVRIVVHDEKGASVMMLATQANIVGKCECSGCI